MPCLDHQAMVRQHTPHPPPATASNSSSNYHHHHHQPPPILITNKTPTSPQCHQPNTPTLDTPSPSTQKTTHMHVHSARRYPIHSHLLSGGVKHQKLGPPAPPHNIGGRTKPSPPVDVSAVYVRISPRVAHGACRRSSSPGPLGVLGDVCLSLSLCCRYRAVEWEHAGVPYFPPLTHACLAPGPARCCGLPW